MKTRIIISTVLIGGIALLGGKCSKTTTTNSNAAAETNTSVNTVSDGVVVQHGVIATFPADVLPLLDRAEVFDSIRNTSDPKLTVHEVEYLSNTGVSELYGKFQTQLTADGWTEQSPQTQTIGTIQFMTGTFVKGADHISIAIQTTVGDEKLQGATKVKLKIEQAQ